MREIPPGYKETGISGEGSAQKTLQIIGGLPPQNIENIDLGWTRINIRVEAGKPVIEYVHDVEANVGLRSKTIGMGKGQIPIEAWDEAKAKGVAYEDFIAGYRGKLVGEAVEEPVAEAGIESVEAIPKAEEGIPKVKEEPIEEVKFKPIIEEEAEAEEEKKLEKEPEPPPPEPEKTGVPSPPVFVGRGNPMVERSYYYEDSELSEEERELRRKKPKNFKPWYETAAYNEQLAPPPARRKKKVVEEDIYEERYLGHKVLPAQLGGSI